MRFCEIQGCPRPVFGTDKKTRTGYCKNHQHLRTDIDKDTIIQRAIKKQRQNAVPKIQSQLRNLLKTDDEVREGSKSINEQERWFRDIRKIMTGKCMNCGGKTEAHTKLFKNSIAHILPKAYFKSVATHPDNFLELCFYGNSCHSQMDNKMLDLIDMNCFDTIIQKFVKMYPNIAQDEKRRIPPILIEYLKIEL